MDSNRPLNHSSSGRRKRFLIGTVTVSMLILFLVFAVGWYYSSLLLDGAFKPDYSPDDLDLRVVSVSKDRITLAPVSSDADEMLTKAGIWGLEMENGYGQVSDILTREEAQVSRGFALVRGNVRPGDLARLDSFAFDGNPERSLGLAFEEAYYQSELGDMPAWLLPGTTDTWVVLVHGWRSDKEEALRILPLLNGLGFPALVIDYRNDEEAPASEDGLIRFGATEWEDLEDAVLFARERGAEDLILYGYSMGGAIVLSFLYNSDAATAVKGVVLDAPMLDFNAVVDHEADKRSLPGFITWLGRQFSSFRFDVSWDELNYLMKADQLETPILLFHGDDDDRVPIETSDRLAAMRADLVTYYRVGRAGHVQSWNVDPGSYETAVQDFLLALSTSDN